LWVFDYQKNGKTFQNPHEIGIENFKNVAKIISPYSNEKFIMPNLLATNNLQKLKKT
jgi:hypothetical protein